MNYELISRFVRRLARIGIDVELTGNYPWIYLNKVNGKKVKGKFYGQHGFTAFMLDIKYESDTPVKFTDIGKVFSKIRETL